MTLFVSLERGGSIGALWHVARTNGDAAGARSSKSMINGTTGDTGDTVTMAMIRLAETRDAGEAVCLRQERNFTLPQSIEDGFFCDNTEEDSV
ncbi:unnamed protein product [Heligmosomoides polygyrus]|uniref:Uncharacterized protein n=1 Tax=Heligmosomoides polygyrus TaxID=6339 RepID=A0A3P8CR63_HELPZ|nr:unnamed protein product [Heligmosomoides polygyrus]